MTEIFFSPTDAEVVDALIVGDHFALSVEHALDEFGRLLDAIDDCAEQNTRGVVSKLRARMAAGTGRVAREHVHAAELLVGERVRVAVEVTIYRRVVANQRHLVELY